MRKGKFATFIILVSFLLMTAVCPVFSLSFESLDAHFGLLFLANADQSQGSAPSPIELMFGVGAQIRFSSLLSLRPGLDFFGREYLWTDHARAVPTNIETGTFTGPIAGVLGIIFSTPLYFDFALAEDVTLGPGIGPAFVFRFPVLPVEDSDTSEMMSYFFNDLRFLYPEISALFSYKLSEIFSFGIQLRALFPIFNLWSGETLSDGSVVPFWDQMLLGGHLGIFIHF